MEEKPSQVLRLVQAVFTAGKVKKVKVRKRKRKFGPKFIRLM
jgi:hypothetical protein